MSTGKRLAKRSIVGTRVSAPFDGHYYTGIIQSVKNGGPVDNRNVYSVLFDNKISGRKVVLDYMAQDLIGPGFQTINNVVLNKGQKVFITYNGREVSAFVDSHNIGGDEVLLTIDLSSNCLNNNTNNKDIINSVISQSMQVKRRLDECRLAESRKSARLLELDTDYSKLADYRTRASSISSTVSSSSMASPHIDVPLTHNGRKRRPSSCEDDVLDDCMAAMVLMSLSCSPQSSLSSQLSEPRVIYQCTWPGCNHQYDICYQIEQHVRTEHLGRSDLKDQEYDDREEEFYYTEVEVSDYSLPSDSSSSSSPAPHSPSESVDDKSDSQSPIPSPHIFFTSSSAPTWTHLEDHEYLKHPTPILEDKRGEIKIKFIQNINSSSFGVDTTLLSAPINIPGMSSPLAQPYAKSAPVSFQAPRAQHKYMRLNGKTVGKVGATTLLQPNSIAKQSPAKRVRGESRKCRKIYGMDNRDAWCTQCKWKKACSRFTD